MTDRDSGIPARIRLYPTDGFEGRHFAESFHAGDARDLDGSWLPDGSVGIDVSAPSLGWRKAAGLVLGGLTAPAMVAGTVVGLRLMFADLWNGKAEGLDGFIMGSGAVITVLVMGLFSLITGVWWLTALAAATSRARLLLTPDALFLKTQWPGTAVHPRATIQTVRLVHRGHTRIGDERVSMDWRLFLLLENGRELSLLSCERDAALAEWLKNRIEQWLAA